MAVYEYRCASGHLIEWHCKMGEAPASVPCGCDGDAVRVYGNIQFSEDRCRLFRNPTDGSSFSYSLGMPYPQSRTQRNMVFDAIGCEPVTRGTMPEQWKCDQEYREHRQHGGERDATFEKTQTGSKPGTVTVLDQLRNAKAIDV